MNTILKFIRSALKDIFANKIRSFLTVLGILIGISSVTLMVSIGGSAQNYISSSITSQLGKDTVIVQPGSSGSGGINFSLSAITSSLSDPDFNAVVNWNNPDVQYVARRSLTSYQLQLGNIAEDSIVMAVDPAIYKIVNLPLVEGRYPSLTSQGNRDILVNQSVVKRFFKLQDPIGKQISVQGYDFTIIGVIQDEAGSSTLGASYMTLMDTQTYREVYRKQDKFQAMVIGTVDGTDVEAFKVKLDRLLRNERGLLASEKSDFSISTQADIVKTTDSILGTVTLFIAVISSISLVVGGVGVMNIMLVSVKERVKEIGLRKAVGATNQDIQTQILIESVLFSLIGGILGIVFGGLGALAIEKIGGLPFFISSSAVTTSLIVSSAVGIVFGLYPAIQAGRLSPIEALRSN